MLLLFYLLISECEVSVSEDLDFLAVMGGAYDGEIGRSNHEVLMGHGVVNAKSLEFIIRHIL